ncbi:DUF6233 domain-containing protein [Streptomyces sp. FIT100]|uniref:DUF6233 domain-containing protein n=1 Tax=Streptomyces sp. FIT100 TaxID=2837956 RepID=UPI0021C72D8E|nr:DUF6233 domain-containing protein [Streptomyces sp. FIT100]UUN29460.1 hypothetical protein KK483_26100 [Streptomyces sp. FIT100]
MSEKVSRLERLHSVREWLVRQLCRTDETVAELERKEAAAAVRASRALPSPEPGWKLSVRRAGGGPAPDPVHGNDCGMAGTSTKVLTREQALRALTEDGVAACPYCRPDNDLGVL